jgi:capsular polysaccharide transport system permease protein
VAIARVRRRHWGVLASFLLLALAPVLVSAWYLFTRAVDQYASVVAFSVRSEETGSAIEFLGGLSELSGSSSSDTDILYEYMQSQKLVAEIDAELDLRMIWSRPESDPVFSYAAPGAIEDLLDHWERMVRIYYDSGTGLIRVRTLAFRPEDATAIAEAIFAKSSSMINALSDIAREDAIRYAKAELETSVERLRLARQILTEFRNRNQIVDPSVDLASQAGLLGTLQVQLVEALIELDLLRETTRSGDPRIDQFERRVAVIEARIRTERRKLGFGDDSDRGEVLATLVGRYEGLIVDREFAEQTYTSSLAAYDAALAEARRQSRYLAAHVQPTMAEKSEYPQRWLLLGLITLFLFLSWSILVMVYYSIRDRR